ncbi:HAMP domain-containing protein [Spirochaetota bacterium]
MNFNLSSLNIKTTFIYSLLAILIISIITAIIFENQSDLIVKNTVLEAERAVYKIDKEIGNIELDKLIGEKERVEAIDTVISSLRFKSYSILNEKADLLKISSESDRSTFSEKIELLNINRAIFRKDNMGKIFYAEIAQTPHKLAKQQVINFYIPLQPKYGRSLIIKLNIPVTGIESQMEQLYKQLGILIAGIIIIVVIIGVFYNRVVIRPIKMISGASKKIAQGNYHVRMSVDNKDEIGTLVDSFNFMVESLDRTSNQLQETISELEEEKERGEMINADLHSEGHSHEDTDVPVDDVYKIDTSAKRMAGRSLKKPINKPYIRIAKKEDSISFVDIPRKIIAGKFQINREKDNIFIRVDRDKLVIVGANSLYSRQIEDEDSIRLVQKDGNTIFIDIPKKILADEIKEQYGEGHNFVRLKNRGMKVRSH